MAAAHDIWTPQLYMNGMEGLDLGMTGNLACSLNIPASGVNDASQPMNISMSECGPSMPPQQQQQVQEWIAQGMAPDQALMLMDQYNQQQQQQQVSQQQFAQQQQQSGIFGFPQIQLPSGGDLLTADSLLNNPGIASLLDMKQPLTRKWPFWRPKTEEELKAKKDKRRMHNRISAKLARERKKKFVASLEEQLLQLQQSVFQLETMRTMLISENSHLRQEVQVVQTSLPQQ